MMTGKHLIANIAKILIGAILAVIGYSGTIDEFWGGMGTALIFVGCVSLIKQFRYEKNEEYKEYVDVENNDERNRYLRMKAWSWSGYLFVVIAAFGSVIFKVIGYDQNALLASGCVCLIAALYWVSYLILKRKY